MRSLFGHRASELKHFWKVAEIAELGYGAKRSLQVEGESLRLLKTKGNTKAREMGSFSHGTRDHSLPIRVTGIKENHWEGARIRIGLLEIQEDHAEKLWL